MKSTTHLPEEVLPRAFIDDILALCKKNNENNNNNTDPAVKKKFILQKLELARKHKLGSVPSDILLLTYLSQEEFDMAKDLLLTKPVRTGSGVTVIAVMTKPLPCPHGKCTYCPGGPGSFFGDTPQSYTGHEPAALRGARARYDMYMQIFNRLEQYIISGHNPEKVELIIMGGTFPSYSKEYQDETIHDIFQAMNDFSEEFYNTTGELNFTKIKTFYGLPGSVNDPNRVTELQTRVTELKHNSKRKNHTIEQLQKENEHTIIRCIGLTIETRPSHALAEHGQIMLEQGCTRVELGVQTTFEDVLTKVHRDHSVQDTKDSIADLRDLGFKLNFHIMLGMPLMNPARDIEAAKMLFDDPAYRPDMLKLYPCMVMPGTPLFYEWKAGKYLPYSTVQAAEVIADIKRFIPKYVRIMRIQRDIPTKVTTAGVGETNLRQTVQEMCDKKGIKCKCIRCREVGVRIIKNVALKVEEFNASGGKEFFISFEDDGEDLLLGFCRLRFPARTLRKEITPHTAIIRELHVYGTATGIGEDGDIQHRGLGRKLMAEAERIAKESGKNRMLVISGVGVRKYYEHLGYTHMGPYMGKDF